MKKITYSTSDFPFGTIYEKMIEMPLTQLHLHTDNVYSEVFKREHDQSTKFHKIYYDNFESKFSKLYDKFISEVIYPLYNESIVYQAIPTFRIHFTNNIAVGEWHKDKWYRDIKWHEQVQELNFYLPFTNAYAENTIWVESAEDNDDLYPMDCLYGECIQWDGANLTHGNKVNLTKDTRVSIDFRIIKYKNYIPSDHGSINMKSKFSIGDYYKLLN